jgi:hypothetical protein
MDGYGNGNMSDRLSTEEVVDRAITNMMVGVSKYYENAKFTSLDRTLNQKDVYDWFLDHKNEGSIKKTNDQLEQQHNSFVKKYNSEKTPKTKEDIFRQYQKKIENIVDCRTTLLDLAKQSDYVANIEHVQNLVALPDNIHDWFEKQGGGRRRKTNKVRKSKVRVFRRKSSKSKKSRKSRK